ncbi:MAG: DUF4331 family protein, partial [Chloroflexi bacterium]|nr:DUF4331 family protein [Chloroflexota bacterium]
DTGGGSQDLSTTVFAMTVNPAAGLISGTTFHSSARYEFVVDRFGLVNGGDAIEVALNARNNSGQTGKAVLRASGDNTVVTISVTPSPSGASQPAHIHKPSPCDKLGGVDYPLTSVVNGQSVTTVKAKLSDILSQPRAINIHKSGKEASIYTSCGELKDAKNATPAVELAINEQNKSGQSGKATLSADGDKTIVKVTTKGFTPGVEQPIHIHKPSPCDKLGGVDYPLTTMVDGQSETVVNAKLSDILSQPRAVNIHKSKTEGSVYTACGNLSSASDVEDFVYRVRVVGDVVLAFRVVKGQERLIAVGPTNQPIVGLEPGMRVFAGLRDDPFFFDLNAFNAGAKFCQGAGGTGSDFFLGLNSSAIVLSVPTSALGASQLGVWAQTMTQDSNGVWVRVDRMGRPAINTAFIPDNPFEARASLEDDFNVTHPRADQAKWRAELVDSLTLLHSLNDATDNKADDAQKVAGLADVLLPDVLTVDLSKATAFLNGRNLADDVMDAELGLITEGAVTTDCVANDSTFSINFPFLGKAN